MAFGFFKKVETADKIFHNGHIYTQDPQLPWAEAVAVKGEKIMGVGNLEGMDALVGKDTELIDLDGKYLLPGFIDVHRSPVLKVFEGKFLDLSEAKSTEEVIDMVRDYAEENPELEIVFGYGYRDDIKPDDEAFIEGEEDNTEECEGEPAEAEAATEASELENSEYTDEAEAVETEIECDASELTDSEAEVLVEIDYEPSPSAIALSKACADRPVLLLCANCVECWTNEAADKIVIATAEEEYVQNITTGYVLNLLIPFDFEEIEAKVKEEIEALSDSGFTSVLNVGSPDYFEEIYQDALIGLYNEGELRQRFFGSMLINRPLLPRVLVHRLMSRRTACTELNGILNADMLYLYLDNENSPIPFKQETLDKICEDVSDKNFGIFLEAIGEDDLLMAYNALEHIRNKGYKNEFVIASDFELPDEEHAEREQSSFVYKTWGTNPLADRSVYGHIGTATEVIDELTTQAARIIGKEDELGSIMAGKYADFAIFDENPLDCEVKTISRLHASMTVLNGEIVYDAESENEMEMWDMMTGQQY